MDLGLLGPQLLIVLDLLGTAVFALSGALVAGRARLDIFGFVVLALAAGCAGGVVRDLLIGAVPPAAVADWRYATVCVVSALVVFTLNKRIARVTGLFRVVDAFGLGLFAAAGTVKSMDAGLSPVADVGLGVMTAVGGGIVRDLLSGSVPIVLRAEVYAVAAAIGSAVLVVASQLGVVSWVSAPAGAAVTIALRLAALRLGWHAPRPRGWIE